jgi:hypothetical protein
LRAVSDSSGVIVKCGSNSDQQGDAQPMRELRHESFLLRCTEPDPYNVGTRSLNVRHDGMFLFVTQWMEWGCVYLHDLDSGKLPLQRSLEFMRDSLCPPVEKMTVTSCNRESAYLGHKVRAKYSINISSALYLSYPD